MRILVSLLLAIVAALPAAAKDAAVAAIGAAAPNFTLTGSDGVTRSLSAGKGKTVVLEWLNYDCPFSKKHYTSGNMQTLQKEYGAKGVVWYSIISSAKGKQGHYPAGAVNEMSQERGAAPAAVLLDGDGRVGRLYDAKTTPHMYVIDPKGVLVYAGAIDDKPTASPDDVAEARSYLREALDAALAGKPVPTAYVKPYGCGVKYR